MFTVASVKSLGQTSDLQSLKIPQRFRAVLIKVGVSESSLIQKGKEGVIFVKNG
jgi:hypothetical protein